MPAYHYATSRAITDNCLQMDSKSTGGIVGSLKQTVDKVTVS